MAGPFLVTNLFHTLPLHPGPKGSGRSLALLRSLAHIRLDMVPERHLTRMVSSAATGLSIRSTKEKYRQRQRGHAKPDNAACRYTNVLKALPVATYHSRHTGDHPRPPAPRRIDAGRLYHEPFDRSSTTAAAYNRTIFIS